MKILFENVDRLEHLEHLERIFCIVGAVMVKLQSRTFVLGKFVGSELGRGSRGGFISGMLMIGHSLVK